MKSGVYPKVLGVLNLASLIRDVLLGIRRTTLDLILRC